jgi:hypothetical protein
MSEPGGYIILATDSVSTGNSQSTGMTTTTLEGVAYNQPAPYPSP